MPPRPHTRPNLTPEQLETVARLRKKHVKLLSNSYVKNYIDPAFINTNIKLLDAIQVLTDENLISTTISDVENSLKARKDNAILRAKLHDIESPSNTEFIPQATINSLTKEVHRILLMPQDLEVRHNTATFCIMKMNETLESVKKHKQRYTKHLKELGLRGIGPAQYGVTSELLQLVVNEHNELSNAKAVYQEVIVKDKILPTNQYWFFDRKNVTYYVIGIRHHTTGDPIGHANSLLVDVQSKSIEYFEPHGSTINEAADAEYQERKTLAENIRAELIRQKILPTDAATTYTLKINTVVIQELYGICAFYSANYIRYRLKDINMTRVLDMMRDRAQMLEDYNEIMEHMSASKGYAQIKPSCNSILSMLVHGDMLDSTTSSRYHLHCVLDGKMRAALVYYDDIVNLSSTENAVSKTTITMDLSEKTITKGFNTPVAFVCIDKRKYTDYVSELNKMCVVCIIHYKPIIEKILNLKLHEIVPYFDAKLAGKQVDDNILNLLKFDDETSDGNRRLAHIYEISIPNLIKFGTFLKASDKPVEVEQGEAKLIEADKLSKKVIVLKCDYDVERFKWFIFSCFLGYNSTPIIRKAFVRPLTVQDNRLDKSITDDDRIIVVLNPEETIEEIETGFKYYNTTNT